MCFEISEKNVSAVSQAFLDHFYEGAILLSVSYRDYDISKESLTNEWNIIEKPSQYRDYLRIKLYYFIYDGIYSFNIFSDEVIFSKSEIVDDSSSAIPLAYQSQRSIEHEIKITESITDSERTYLDLIIENSKDYFEDFLFELNQTNATEDYLVKIEDESFRAKLTLMSRQLVP